MSGGGNLSRRSWIERLSVAAFRPSSSTYFCCSSVNTNGIRFFSSLPSFPFLPTTSAAQASSPAISSSPWLFGLTESGELARRIAVLNRSGWCLNRFSFVDSLIGSVWIRLGMNRKEHAKWLSLYPSYIGLQKGLLKHFFFLSKGPFKT